MAWNATIQRMVMMLVTPITPATLHTPRMHVNTSHPLHGPISWSDHWSHAHPIPTATSLYDTLLFRYAFLAFMSCRVMLVLCRASITWYHALQQTAYEQRWMVGRTLMNVSEKKTTTTTTTAALATDTAPVIVTSSAATDTSIDTSPAMSATDERTLAWVEDDDPDVDDEKLAVSVKSTFHARHVLSTS